MLDELAVRNLGVIEEARLEPGARFTVITGETGTGKTLLLGALRMLLGADARPDLVGPFEEQAVVEGRFLRNRDEVAVARRLPRGGRSRAYLDGSIASAQALDTAVGSLVEVVGQHDQLKISRSGELRRLVDGTLTDRGKELRDRYTEKWARHVALLSELGELGGDRHALERERELLGYQVSEIEAAAIDLDRDSRLEANIHRMRHSQTIRTHLGDAIDAVAEVRERFSTAMGELQRALALDPALGAIASDAGTIEGNLGELAAAMRNEAEAVETDPAEVEAAEARIRVLSDLKRKYGDDLASVLTYCEEVAARSDRLARLLDDADSLSSRIEAAELELIDTGARLREERAEAAERLSGRAVGHLVELGFSDPILRLVLDESEPGPTGADRLSLGFASDSRLQVGDIKNVASGGELSRLILALRLSGDAGEVPTLVFDEIDSGVGGATALAVGRKLASLADDRQVLCVTHLPQVAAFADTHFVIDRTGTTARVRRVEGGARLEELSRMLSGLPEGDHARLAAAELLQLAQPSSEDTHR
jgi:DNA repair protein RecN (Recombination protein N)